jgi:FkbM family methyltransferase
MTKTTLRLPPALKRFLAMEPFSDFRYLYSLARGRPEPEPAFGTISVSIRPSDVVVEVGAARGGGTLFLSSRARHVYAFEPNKYSYRILRHFTTGRPNISTFNVAVGSSRGVARLNMVADEATSYACSIRVLEGLEYRGHMDVPVVRLDDVEFPVTPSVLIIDCEGYEYEVLAGAKHLLDKVRSVFIETHVLSGGEGTLDRVRSQVEALPMKVDVFPSEDGLLWVAGTRLEPLIR